jgi:type IV pilus assembly protein PilM
MANPLSSLFNMFQKPAQSVLGIDIGSSSIKFVQLKRKSGRAVLETYGELALGPYSGLEIGRATGLQADKLSEALKDLLREGKTSTTKCGVAIPFPSSLVSLIELPTFDQKQLGQIIPIEARKYIPVPISEVSLDWWVIPKEDDKFTNSAMSEGAVPNEEVKSKTEVLIVAIHNEALSKYKTIVNSNNLDTSFFEIEVFSTMRAILDPEPGAILILDMGAGATKLYIIDHGIVRTSHTINKGGQDLSMSVASALNVPLAQAEELKRSFGLSMKKDGEDFPDVMSGTLSYIFLEANRLLLNYQKKYNRTISKVVLTGGGANLKGLSEFAGTNFQVPIMMADPFSKVEAPAFLEKVLAGAGPEFAVAIGTALRRLQEVE